MRIAALSLGLLGLWLAAAAPAVAQSAEALASRIQELEREVRELRARLDRLEGRAPPPVAAAPPTPARPEAPARPAAAADPAAERGYILGTLPGEALRQDAPPPQPAPADPDSATRLARAIEGRDPVRRYDAAMDFLRRNDWAAAEQALEAYLRDFPEHERSPAAGYWLGETHFVRQDYAEAAAAFARTYRTYGPTAPRAADTLLKLGMSLARLGDRDRACQTFDELGRRHDDAPAPVRQTLVRERAAYGCG
jgi:tol-pal system protein YbgF